MKAAFSFWGDRIAPVLDVSETVRIVEAEEGSVVSSEDIAIGGSTPAGMIGDLVRRGVGELVCGAVSRPFRGLLGAYGIEVHPFVSGALEAVIGAWLEGRLGEVEFNMPGCRGGGSGFAAGRPGRRSGMNSGRGRPAGGGGRGRMGGTGAGPAGRCLCPSCGYAEPHERGVPCLGRKCPRCGTAMTRE